MPKPLDVVLSGVDLEIAGQVWEGRFYECRDGSIVGPMIDDGLDPSFGYAAVLGADRGEHWLPDGWSRAGERGRDLVKEVSPPLTWTGREWRQADKQTTIQINLDKGVPARTMYQVWRDISARLKHT